MCDDPQLLSHFCSCGSTSTQFSSQDPDDVTDGALYTSAPFEETHSG